MSITLTLIPIIALPVLALVGWWRVTRDTITGSIERALVAGICKFATGLPVVYSGHNTMEDELASYDFIRPKFLADVSKRVGKFLGKGEPWA